MTEQETIGRGGKPRRGTERPSKDEAHGQLPADDSVDALPRILTAGHAATFLGLNVKSVYAALRSGELPGRRIGRRVVILREALLDWLKGSQ